MLTFCEKMPFPMTFFAILKEALGQTHCNSAFKGIFKNIEMYSSFFFLSFFALYYEDIMPGPAFLPDLTRC